MKFEDLLEIQPYSLDKDEKNKALTEITFDLTRKHKTNCKEYSDMLDCMSFDVNKASSYLDLPFLPVRLFKELDLKSIDDENIVKTMTSSGTTGQKVSKIYLDKVTSSNQQKAMVKIVSSFTGSSRMPMIIIDSPSVLKDRKKFSARGAGILGFSIFGSKKFYALDDDMKLDVDGLKEFLSQHDGEKILLFGFTYMIWQHFYKELEALKKQGVEFNLSNGILIHGGGWKKLQNEAVSQEEFHDRLKSVCGLDRIHDYYGMVEQTGCIYMQCECGHLHASIFSDVITRRAEDFSPCDYGEPGIIQVVSSIPESYPGHSLLTEDKGMILGEDDCPCGRKGKYFKILGRIEKAEIRGCSDTYTLNNIQKESIDESVDKMDALNKVDFLVGNRKNIDIIDSVSVMEPFSDEIIEFSTEVSSELMKDRDAKAFPDVVSLGFWLRKASLEKFKERFKSDSKQVGRGVVFHIAPSNVPVNYAYSLFTGLLCGNANIVRIPSKQFPQVDLINRAIKKVLDKKEYNYLSPYINLIRYDRDKDVNDCLSNICDVRIIWGGDNTVEDIRKSKLKSRATEITFADRYSLAVIDADKYMNEDAKKIAEAFYNDTYLTDQNACTSPRIVAWLGDNPEKAKERFWEELLKLVENKYALHEIQSVDKLTQLCIASTEIDGLEKEKATNNFIYRINMKKLNSNIMNYRGNSGYFYEYDCKDVLELRELCNNVHCQTIACLCDANKLEPLINSGIKGVDRVVPFGQTMNFDLIWDGYNLVEHLTRNVTFSGGIQ